MATGRIKELVDIYEDARARKERLAKEKTEAEKAFKAAQEELAIAISDADMSAIQDGSFSYAPTVKRKFNFKSAANLAELGIDKIELFKSDERLKDLVVETISAGAMNSALGELAGTEEGIPEEVLEAVNIYDEISISRTKKDTTAKNKVKDAIKNRRAQDV
ncbi:MAG: hypothetical protein LUC83_10010 [Clostridiales bacterium]|nr:hypothetical protein [Clostridiales bacterium]